MLPSAWRNGLNLFSSRRQSSISLLTAASLSLTIFPGSAIAQDPATDSSQSLPAPSCAAPVAKPLAVQQAASQILEVATWVNTPINTVEALVRNWGPQIMALSTPVAWPQISDRAQKAQVPVLMYHDILPEKQVFFDVTPEEFEAHLQLIQTSGATPISLDQLVTHLRTGIPLPEKPVLLTFDDGYKGHYQHVYPLLKKYGYPAVFSIYTDKIDKQLGRSSMTWDEVQEMAADPLITIASHSISHPRDLTQLETAEMEREVKASKQALEEKLGRPIHYFTYPEGHYNEAVAEAVEAAGYRAALTMDDWDERFAGESESLLAIARFGQSRIQEVLTEAWGGPSLPRWTTGFNFAAAVELNNVTYDEVPLTLISGGRPITIHADSRYQVPEILAGTEAIAAVDGGFFSLEFLDSNVMIGPVYSQSTGKFIPGNRGENPKLRNRPLVLIGPTAAQFLPFDPDQHNTLEGLQAEMPNVTDAFVGAAWLVKNGLPQPPSSFGSLFDFDAERHRAFWGINQAGQPVIGVSHEPVDSVSLGEILAEAGLRDAVMLDSGASTSLAYQGESLVGYEPRPVPHVVALVPPDGVAVSPRSAEDCVMAFR